MRRLTPDSAGESGQSLMLLVLALTVMFVVGAITVDVGLWLAERRGSQKDADFAALTGAYQLIDPSGMSADAISAATDALAKNDQLDNASFPNPVLVDDSCFNQGEDDAVTVDVEHDSVSLFSGIFGVLEPDIGAHAKACVGASQGGGNLVPFEIDTTSPCFDSNQEPLYTKLCPLEGGAHTPNPRGMLDLEAPGNYCSQSGGSGDIEDLIADGAPGTCMINPGDTCDPDNVGPWYNCVAVQDGNPQNVIDGVRTRVSRDGACDENFGNGDGVDDFDETVIVAFPDPGGDPFKHIYAPRDCDPDEDGVQISSRLVTIIVLENPPTVGGSEGYPIYAFAGFYISGCADEAIDVQVTPDLIDPDCQAPGAKMLPYADDDLYVSAVVPGRNTDARAAPAPLADKTLTVTKQVVGGSAQPSDFTMRVSVNGNPFIQFPGSASGTSVQVPNGSQIQVTETGPAGYTGVFTNCSGNVGNGMNCLVVNTFGSPSATPTPSPTPAPVRRTLTVVKEVVGGTAQPDDFTITVVSSGNPSPASFPGSSTGTAVLLDDDSDYAISETAASGYVATFSGGCDGTIHNDNTTCTITNTYGGGTGEPGCQAVGQCVVYGRFVNLILSGGGVGPPNQSTTVFGIALVE